MAALLFIYDGHIPNRRAFVFNHAIGDARHIYICEFFFKLLAFSFNPGKRKYEEASTLAGTHKNRSVDTARFNGAKVLFLANSNDESTA